MRNGNRNLLIIAILLMLVTISLSSYAIYKSSATGTASADVAAWVVKVDGTNIVSSNTFTANDIVWSQNSNIKSGKIAPGSQGTITFEIDASESEVALDYTVSVDTANITNNKITVTNAGANASGTIAYSSTAANMKKTVTINVAWTAEDVEATNTSDMAIAGTTIEIPIVVTVTQHTGA